MVARSKTFVYEQESLREARRHLRKIGAPASAIKASESNIRKAYRELNDNFEGNGLSTTQKRSYQKKLYDQIKNTNPTKGKVIKAPIEFEVKQKSLSKTQKARAKRTQAQIKKTQEDFASKVLKDVHIKKPKSAKKNKKVNDKYKELVKQDRKKNRLSKKILELSFAERARSNGDFLTAMNVIKGDFVIYLRNEFKSRYGQFPTSEQLNLALLAIKNEVDSELKSHPGAYGYPDPNQNNSAYNLLDDTVDTAVQHYFAINRI